MLIITFSTNDLFIFYLGFEGLSIPIFFLIFLFGADLTKIRASVYYLIYSFISSVCMALSIFLLYAQTGTTNIHKLTLYFTLNTNSFLYPIKNYDYLYLNYKDVSLLSYERLNII